MVEIQHVIVNYLLDISMVISLNRCMTNKLTGLQTEPTKNCKKTYLKIDGR